MNILVFIQSDSGIINRISIEAVCFAQNIKAKSGCLISAVCVNKEATEWAKGIELDAVVDCSASSSLDYHPLEYTEIMDKVINQVKPSLVIVGHTYQARDWVPRLSARVNAPFISDCISVEYNNEDLVYTRQIYQGKINQDIASRSDITIASIQAGSCNPDTIKKGAPDTSTIDVKLSENTGSITQEERFQEQAGGVDLTKAKIIVSVGRGISKEENIPMAKELAKGLNAELGSSRPIVDQGWIEHDRQIGSSGQVVSPKLYFSIGISGAIQHQVGMKGSDNILAINKDPNAPIFEIADYGIVGDIFEIVPKIIEKIK